LNVCVPRVVIMVPGACCKFVSRLSAKHPSLTIFLLNRGAAKSRR
jgi:hypothetical protein